MSDTKEKVMNWIRHECSNYYGWREDYALEVLVGIIAGAIDGSDDQYGYASWDDIVLEVTA
tara:strand:+ start:336 stop:518 length:183 start_codon:yes stop_codon:yes gene_type:complete